MLTEVADGVWVRQSSWVWSNAIVVRAEDGLVLVDPGIDGSELDELADDVQRLGVPVVAGFCTHPHWDHLLWHPRFGDVPRYATGACARTATDAGERAQAMAADSASGNPLELVALVSPLPADGGAVPGTLVEHEAHAVGHAALLLADRGVLLDGAEVAARLAADHAYIDALRRGEEPVEARLEQDWLSGPHRSNLELARHSGDASGGTAAAKRVDR